MEKSLAIAAALLSTAAAVQAEGLFVNIRSGHAMAQGAGLVLAGQALDQNASVRVLLRDEAGDIALTGKEMPTLKPRNMAPQSRCRRACSRPAPRSRSARCIYTTAVSRPAT